MEYDFNEPLVLAPFSVRFKDSVIDFKESCKALGVKHRKKVG